MRTCSDKMTMAGRRALWGGRGGGGANQRRTMLNQKASCNNNVMYCVCHAFLCFALLCLAVACLCLCCHTVLWFALPCNALCCVEMLDVAVPCHVLCCLALDCCVLHALHCLPCPNYKQTYEQMPKLKQNAPALTPPLKQK